MSSAEIVTMIVAVFASTGLWTFVAKVYDAHRADKAAKEKQIDPETIRLQQEALVALLHDRIYELGSAYIDRGWLTLDEYDNFSYLSKAYAGLHGNGTGEKLKKEVDELPIAKEEPAND